MLLFFLGLGWGSVSQASSDIDGKTFPGDYNKPFREVAKYRFEFDNDIVFGSDNAFTNGWSFQMHSPVADDWDSLQGVSQWVKDFGGWIPSLSGPDLKYRVSGSLGQVIQTPNDIEAANNIENDFPYAGILAFQGSWIAFNDETFKGFEVVLGVTGRPSLAEQTQNFVHFVTDSVIAEGWDNQLKEEPVLNFNYMRKTKFYNTDSMDMSISGLAAVGTMFTLADIRLETRYGVNRPRGFAYSPDSIGRSMIYDATLSPTDSKSASYYTTLIIGVAAVGHKIMLDGNVLRDAPDNNIEKESSIGFLLFGLNYAKEDWGLSFSWAISTNAVKTNGLADGAEATVDFGTIMFEWRIN